MKPKDKTGKFIKVHEKCRIKDCPKTFRINIKTGLCVNHYARFKRTGNPEVKYKNGYLIKLSEEELIKRRRQARLKYKHSEKGKNKERIYRSTETAKKCNRKSVKIRRKRLKLSIPPWQCRKELREIYKKSNKDFHIDHIHPLVIYDEYGNHFACGLTVPWNLQLVPREFNEKKGNKIMVYNGD